MITCFEIRLGRVEPGIPIADDGNIYVGEKGRGRELVVVPPPAVNRIENGRLVLAQTSVRDGVAVVLIRDHSGYRGGWRLRAARTTEEWDLIVRRDAAHYQEGAREDGHRGEPRECPTCKSMFHIPEERKPRAHVIAQGWCAMGMAGNMGGGPEYLLVLLKYQPLEIFRYGRLYGDPQVLRVDYDPDTHTVVVSDPRAAAISRMAAAQW